MNMQFQVPMTRNRHLGACSSMQVQGAGRGLKATIHSKRCRPVWLSRLLRQTRTPSSMPHASLKANTADLTQSVVFCRLPTERVRGAVDAGTHSPAPPGVAREGRAVWVLYLQVQRTCEELQSGTEGEEMEEDNSNKPPALHMNVSGGELHCRLSCQTSSTAGWQHTLNAAQLSLLLPGKLC